MDVDLLDDDQQKLLKQAMHEGKINSLAGWNVCITGTLSMPRAHMRSLIVALNGRNTMDVDRSTNLLIVADVNTRTDKAIKARSMGIKIVSEQEFTDMLAVPTT